MQESKKMSFMVEGMYRTLFFFSFPYCFCNIFIKSALTLRNKNTHVQLGYIFILAYLVDTTTHDLFHTKRMQDIYVVNLSPNTSYPRASKITRGPCHSHHSIPICMPSLSLSPSPGPFLSSRFRLQL